MFSTNLVIVSLVLLYGQLANAQIIPPHYIPPSDNDKTYIPVFRDYDPLRDDIADSIRQFRSPQRWNVIQILEESDTTKVVAQDTFAKAVAFVNDSPIITVEVSEYRNYTFSWINDELVHVSNSPGRCVSVDTIYNLRVKRIEYHAVFNHCGV